MNPATTIVGLATYLDISTSQCDMFKVSDAEEKQISYDDETVLDVAEEKSKLEFRNADGKVVHYFSEGKAWDAKKNVTKSAPEGSYSIEENNPGAERHLVKILKKINNKPAMIEGVPYSWLMEADREFPVVIDYEDKSGSETVSQAWVAGETYFISDNYTIPSGKSLVIEGGAVVKINGGKKINIASGATLKAIGSKFNYVIITNGADSIGDSVTGHEDYNGSNYSVGFQTTGGTPEIEYCKFDNGDTHLLIGNATEANISNCMFP